MRDLIPYIFWPWFGVSCFVLLRRRVSNGTWRAMSEQDGPAEIEFPPPPPAAPPEPLVIDQLAPTPQPVDSALEPTTPESRGDVAVVSPIDPDRPRSRSLAEAVEGIAMPCELAPLMGTGRVDPREVAFVTDGFQAATVGAALSDELERLGYEITPLDDRSIRAVRGPDTIEARLLSSDLTSEEVLRELHPSAPSGALIVEMKLR